MKELVRSCVRFALTPIRPLFDREIANQIKSHTFLESIQKAGPDDIFVVGYPKSGNTWLQHLLTSLVYGLDIRYTPPVLMNDLMPDLDVRKFYRRYCSPMFFRTHDLPKPTFRRVIYLIRDGRDVMVSFFHYQAALDGAAPDFEKIVNGAGLPFPCRWDEHVEAWMANPYGAEMMIVRYEALKQDAAAELARIAAFGGLDRDRASVDAAVRNCTFEAMKRYEETMGFETFPKEKQFVRRGIVGSFKDEMPTEILGAFTRQSARALRAAGYSTD